MKKILILTGRYLPGHKDGGPLRTLINVTDALGDEYEFYIGCLDRDHGDDKPYQNIKKDEWNQVEKAKVWYVEPGQFTNELLLRLASGKDLIYLCSFYDDYGYKLLLLNKKNKIQCPVVVASMGVFAEAALKQKSAKKRIFISLCKFLGLFKNITWSVTSELEAKDVKKAMGNNIDYIVAEDLPRLSIPGKTKKEYSGILKVVFLSRICAHKNLDFAIRALNKMKEPVEFTIYGPIQEMEYWEKCEELLKNVRFSWTYGGDVPSEQVQKTLADYDVLIFPSKSENYGHVIFEALSVGCIPVISDKTPWNELNNKKAGYELPLDESIFTNTLDDFANLSVQEKEKLENNAIQYANEKLTTSLKETGYRKIFG